MNGGKQGWIVNLPEYQFRRIAGFEGEKKKKTLTNKYTPDVERVKLKGQSSCFWRMGNVQKGGRGARRSKHMGKSWVG